MNGFPSETRYHEIMLIVFHSVAAIVLSLSFNFSDGSQSRFVRCLPTEISPGQVVLTSPPADSGSAKAKPVTVKQRLVQLKARCRKGKLIDGKGRQIYLYQLTGCWGNPPEDYQQILERQRQELIRLRKRYTVIELTCGLDRLISRLMPSAQTLSVQYIGLSERVAAPPP